MNANAPLRLTRWMLESQQPKPYSLGLDHPAQEDIAWAADHITDLETQLAELRAENTEIQTLVGKLTLGALDFCSIHGNMRKSDLPWPCGMCEEIRAEAAEAKVTRVSQFRSGLKAGTTSSYQYILTAFVIDELQTALSDDKGEAG